MKRFYALLGKSEDDGQMSVNLIFWSTKRQVVQDLTGALSLPMMKLRTEEVLLWKEVGELRNYLQSLVSGLALSLTDQSTPVVDGKVPYLVWSAKDSGVVYAENLTILSVTENAKLATSMIEIKYPEPGDKTIKAFENELTMYAIVMASGPIPAFQLGQLIVQQITDNDEWRPTSCF